MAAKKQRARKKPPRRPKSFDMALIQRGARLRRSPFFESTLRAGCKSYTIYNHTFLPSYYDDPVREYWHLLENVALWDVAVERNVEIAGPDGFEFMQLLTPQVFTKEKFLQLAKSKQEPHASELFLLKGSPLNVRVTSPDAGTVNALIKILPKPKVKPPSSPFEEAQW